jgi:hypothetical protein
MIHSSLCRIDLLILEKKKKKKKKKKKILKKLTKGSKNFNVKF